MSVFAYPFCKIITNMCMCSMRTFLCHCINLVLVNDQALKSSRIFMSPVCMWPTVHSCSSKFNFCVIYGQYLTIVERWQQIITLFLISQKNQHACLRLGQNSRKIPTETKVILKIFLFKAFHRLHKLHEAYKTQHI